MEDNYVFLKVEEKHEGYGIVYTFATPKYGYTVYFNDTVYADLVSDMTFLSESYSFGFMQTEVNPQEPKRGDTKVPYTIVAIVEDFLNANPDAVILFHCDTSDEKQYHRHKTFNKWYQSSPIKESVVMYTVSVQVNNITNYLGYIVSNKNDHIAEITKEFEQVATKSLK